MPSPPVPDGAPSAAPPQSTVPAAAPRSPPVERYSPPPKRLSPPAKKRGSPAFSPAVSELSADADGDTAVVQRRCAGCDAVVYARAVHAASPLFCRECSAEGAGLAPSGGPDFLSDPEFVSAVSLSDAAVVSASTSRLSAHSAGSSVDIALSSSDDDSDCDSDDGARSASETYLEDLGGDIVRDSSGWGICVPHTAIARTYDSDEEPEEKGLVADDWADAADLALDEELSDSSVDVPRSQKGREMGDGLDLEPASEKWGHEADIALDAEPTSQKLGRETNIALELEPVSQKLARDADVTQNAEPTSQKWVRSADIAFPSECSSPKRLSSDSESIDLDPSSSKWARDADIALDALDAELELELERADSGSSEQQALDRALRDATAVEAAVDLSPLHLDSPAASPRRASPRRSRSRASAASSAPAPALPPPPAESRDATPELAPRPAPRRRSTTPDVVPMAALSNPSDTSRRATLLQRLRAARAELEVVQMATAAASAAAQVAASARTADEAKGRLRAERAGLAATVDFLARLALEGAVGALSREGDTASAQKPAPGARHRCECR